MHYLTSILLKFVSAKIDNLEPCGFSVIKFSEHKFQQNLTSILLKFVSAKFDNRETAGFKVMNFSGHKVQQNTREIMLLLSHIKYQQVNNNNKQASEQPINKNLVFVP